jgi:glycosyltransferase involved in cell wall biosynthesis
VRTDRNNRLWLQDDSFEVIISTEVIEHLENSRATFREFHRLFRPGGSIIDTTPNQERIPDPRGQPVCRAVKILLSSHSFSPSIGGLESCSLDLALSFARMGHDVEIVTQAISEIPSDDHGLKVWRRPGKHVLFQRVCWCDVFFHNNVSLQAAWPLIFIRRPWIVTTETWLRKPDGSVGIAERMKRHLLRFATNVYISKAIQAHIGYDGYVVPNPYDSETFQLIPGIERNYSLVFLGRLVSDKGCDLLIQCLGLLRAAGLSVPLTIIGSGPDETKLKEMAASLKLDGFIHFAGALKGRALAEELNRHQVLVVPSRWAEPFGIVALEGIACGCLVVGSSAGGLGDAIGNCGVTFKNGDVADLARAIREILERQEHDEHSGVVSNHLHRHRADVVAGHYLKIFKHLCLEGRNDAALEHRK